MLDPFRVWSAVEIIYRRSNGVARAEREHTSVGRMRRYIVAYGLEAELYDDLPLPDELKSKMEVSRFYVTPERVSNLVGCDEEEARRWLDRFVHYEILKEARSKLGDENEDLFMPTKEDPDRIFKVLNALTKRVEQENNEE